MTAAVARAVMALASRCLGAGRRDWGLAMEAEFEAAVDDGRPLAFATGCLIAAWRAMARESEGRLTLALHLLALGLLLPIAALQFEQVIGMSTSFVDAAPGGMLAVGVGSNPYLAWAQTTAMPVLLILWVLLGTAHLCLAWALVDGNWTGVVRFGALIGAATITLSLFAGVLMLDLSFLNAHAAGLGLELAAILTTARWHARLCSPTSPERLAR